MARSTVVPILPHGRILPDPRKLKRAVENSLTGTAKAIKIDYDVTTQTWSNRPPFTIITERWYERLITTESKVYLYVTGGTRPHTIRPVNAPALRFQWGGPGSYQAKTAPRIVASRAGGPSGPIVYRQEVHHPGTEARKFEVVISDKWRKQWPTVLSRAIASEMVF